VSVLGFVLVGFRVSPCASTLLALELLFCRGPQIGGSSGDCIFVDSGSVAEFLDKQHHYQGTRGEEEQEE
jgi:hypothetical protein